jgi:hypothetical protein
MFNMDMVGRMTDDELIVYGTGTANEFDGLIDRINERHGFQIKRESGGFGPSDHSSFYAVQVPVLHFFTGLHNDYHRPSDDANKLNVPGIRRVSEMVAEAVVRIADANERPQFVEVTQPMRAGGNARRGDRPYFGSIPQMPSKADGYELMGVSKGGPAEKAGLRRGDVITRLGENQIGNLDDFDSALRKFEAGQSVPVVVRRDGKEVKLEVTLEPPR